MIPPTSIDGTDITGATIDGTDVTEITVDGQTVFTAGPGGVAPGATLLAHYPLDEGSGTTAADATGNEPNISLENGASFVSDADGIGGFSVDCDGSNDFLELDPEPTFIKTPFTVMITIDLDSTSAEQTFLDGEGDNFLGFGIGRNSPNIAADGSNGSRASIEAVSGPTTSKTRLGFEFDNSVPQKIFVNGFDDTDGPTSNLPKISANTNVPLTFMRQNSAVAHTDGKIDNIVFYDGSLTSAEVTADFDAQPYS